jgi:hypothetical protein
MFSSISLVDSPLGPSNTQHQQIHQIRIASPDLHHVPPPLPDQPNVRRISSISLVICTTWLNNGYSAVHTLPSHFQPFVLVWNHTREKLLDFFNDITAATCVPSPLNMPKLVWTCGQGCLVKIITRPDQWGTPLKAFSCTNTWETPLEMLLGSPMITPHLVPIGIFCLAMSADSYEVNSVIIPSDYVHFE